MKNIKIGTAQRGFLKSSSVAYMYFRSPTIFFRSSLDVNRYWFDAPLERFVQAITHETVHMVLLRRCGRTVSRRLDRILGEIEALEPLIMSSITVPYFLMKDDIERLE